MALEGFKQACQQAAHVLRTEYNPVKAVLAFVSTLWNGKRVSITAPTASQHHADLQNDTKLAATSLQERNASTVKTPKKLLKTEENQKPAFSSTHDRHVNYSPEAGASSGKMGEIHEEEQFVPTKTHDDHNVDGGGELGEFNLSATVRDSLLQIIRKEGVQGFKDYVDAGYGNDSLAKLLDIRDFLVSKQKFSDEIAKVWLHTFCKEIAALTVRNTLHETLMEFEDDKSLSKEELHQELTALESDFDVLANFANDSLQEYAEGLSKRELAVLQQSIPRYISGAAKGLTEDLESFWNDITNKRNDRALHKTDSAFTRLQHIDELEQHKIITQKESEELRSERARKLEEINAKWNRDYSND